MCPAIACLTVIIGLVETLFQVAVITKTYTTYWELSVSLLTLLLAGHVLSNALSFIWIYKKSDFKKDKTNSIEDITLCAIMHILLQGMVWRCLQMVRQQRCCSVSAASSCMCHRVEEEDTSRLRMLQACVQSAPCLILLGHQLLSSVPHADWLVVSTVSVTYVTLSLTHTWCTCFHLLPSKPTGQDSLRQLVTCALSLMRHGLMLASRLLAAILFMTMYQFWILAIFSAHMIIYAAVAAIKHHLFKTHGQNNVNKNAKVSNIVNQEILLGLAQTFEVLDTPDNPVCCQILLYSFIFVENIAMAALGLSPKVMLSTYGVIVLLVVSGCFILGLVLILVATRCNLRRYGSVKPQNSSRCPCLCCKRTPKNTEQPKICTDNTALQASLQSLTNDFCSPEQIVACSFDNHAFVLNDTLDKSLCVINGSSTQYIQCYDGLKPQEVLLDNTQCVKQLDDTGYYSRDTDTSVVYQQENTKVHVKRHAKLKSKLFKSKSTPSQQKFQSKPPVIGKRNQNLIQSGKSVSQWPWPTKTHTNHCDLNSSSTCSETFCNICDPNSETRSTSYTTDTYGVLDSEMECNMTWPQRTLSTRNISSLPNQTMDCHEHVQNWLDKIEDPCVGVAVSTSSSCAATDDSGCFVSASKCPKNVGLSLPILCTSAQYVVQQQIRANTPHRNIRKKKHRHQKGVTSVLYNNSHKDTLV